MEATVNGIRNVWRAVLNFWFAPTDPTTLGFIRVVTGLLIVYTHLAYCYDLTGFFGKTAWYDLASIDRERKEYPHITPPWNGWDDRVYSARLPDPPHRKRAFLTWMRSVTADEASRERSLKLLRDLRATKDGGTIRAVITYVQQLRSDPAARKAHLDALVKVSLRNPVDESVIPQYLKNLPETGPVSRESYRNSIDLFYAGLPNDLDDRQYVMNFLLELDDPNREATIAFLEDERTGKEEIDYLEYWNFDRAKTLRTGQPIFSIWFHITDPVEMGLAHGIVLVIMTMFTLGLWTRVTSVLTWLAAVSYIHRTQYVLFGMDTMSNILLLYLMVGNSGGAFSLDRVIARYRATRASIRKSGGIDGATAAFLASPPQTVSAGLALRLIQVHFCFIYMAAGLSKLKGQTWWNHNAYWETAANPEFTMIQFEWYEAMMRSLASIRPAYALVAAGAIFHTFIAEIGLPFLVWTRARPWIVIVGLLLHTGIAIFMGLTVFSLLMMIMLLAYLPGVAIRGRLFGSSGETLAVSFNPKDESQAAAAARAVAIDTEGAVALKPDVQAKDLEIHMGSKSVTGSDAARAVIGKSNFLSWATWIPGLPGLFTRWLAPKAS
jgi:hypothetical protein